MNNSPKLVMTEVEFYKDELRVVAEVAAASNQTIPEFMRDATREGLAEYKKNKTRFKHKVSAQYVLDHLRD